MLTYSNLITNNNINRWCPRDGYIFLASFYNMKMINNEMELSDVCLQMVRNKHTLKQSADTITIYGILCPLQNKAHICQHTLKGSWNVLSTCVILVILSGYFPWTTSSEFLWLSRALYLESTPIDLLDPPPEDIFVQYIAEKTVACKETLLHLREPSASCGCESSTKKKTTHSTAKIKMEAGLLAQSHHIGLLFCDL